MTDADARLALVERFFAGTGDTYDLMVNLATVGGDRRWKRHIVAQIPQGARRTLDLACGTGISTLAIARQHPDARVVGVELRDEYLDIAREKVRWEGHANIELVTARAEEYRSDKPFDCIVSSYLAKYADLPLLARNARTMLADGGLFLAHDFTYPATPRLARLWRLHFAVLRTLVGPLFPAWREIFVGLPDLVARTRWVEELEAALAGSGFSDIRREVLSAYGSTLVTARARGDAHAAAR